MQSHKLRKVGLIPARATNKGKEMFRYRFTYRGFVISRNYDGFGYIWSAVAQNNRIAMTGYLSCPMVMSAVDMYLDT